MDNIELFHLINAGPDLGTVPRLLATFVGEWMGYPIGVALIVLGIRRDRSTRTDLLEMLAAALLSLALARLVSHVWPYPRPFVLHLGTQYLPHGASPSLPSSHTTFFVALALAAFWTRRLAVFGLPLLAAALLIGWARVFLGVHFPYDVLATFPVAAGGVAASHGIRLAAQRWAPGRAPRPARAHALPQAPSG